MRSDIIDIIKAQPRQHSNEWYKCRLGHFTGSQVGRLMKRGRGKDAEWSADALTYIKEIVAERLINPTILAIPDLFDQYLDFTVASSKMMAWGNDHEQDALGAYVSLKRHKVTSCGSLPHAELAMFWDSPDGILLDADGTVEVKCPAPKTHAEYLTSVHDGESLRKVNEVYYWQVMSHMAVTGASFTDWMSYCPFLKPSLHVVTIERDEDAIGQMLERIEAADKIAESMVLAVRGHKTSGAGVS